MRCFVAGPKGPALRSKGPALRCFCDLRRALHRRSPARAGPRAGQSGVGAAAAVGGAAGLSGGADPGRAADLLRAVRVLSRPRRDGRRVGAGPDACGGRRRGRARRQAGSAPACRTRGQRHAGFRAQRHRSRRGRRLRARPEDEGGVVDRRPAHGGYHRPPDRRSGSGTAVLRGVLRQLSFAHRRSRGRGDSAARSPAAAADALSSAGPRWIEGHRDRDARIRAGGHRPPDLPRRVHDRRSPIRAVGIVPGQRDRSSSSSTIRCRPMSINLRKYTDGDMHDVLAYLQTLR